MFTEDKHPLFRDESSSSDAGSTSLLFADGRPIKRRKARSTFHTSTCCNSCPCHLPQMGNEYSTLCMGCEKSMRTGPIAKSITALAHQTNMAIAALALRMNRGKDEIWKDLRGRLDHTIGFRDAPLTLCGDMRDDV